MGYLLGYYRMARQAARKDTFTFTKIDGWSAWALMQKKNDKSVVGLQSFLNLVSNIIYYSIILKENSSIKWKDFTWMRNTIRREEDNEHWHIYQIMARASLCSIFVLTRNYLSFRLSCYDTKCSRWKATEMLKLSNYRFCLYCLCCVK